MNVLFYSTKEYDKKYFDRENNYQINIDYVVCPLDVHTVGLAKKYSAISIFVNDRCDAKILEKLGYFGVKWVFLRCCGFNNVDIEAAKKQGILVARVPKYSPESVSEYTAGLLLCLIRKINKAYNLVKMQNFSLDRLVGTTLHKKTVGVIGYGEIGRSFAQIMTGFNCEVLVYEPFDVKMKAGHTKVGLDELFHQADIISLHCPLTPETKHLINEKTIQRMQNDVVLLNTSRGALMDTRAVVKALRSKKIGGLAVDVYEEEGGLFFEDHSEKIINDENFEMLITLPNVLITGHQAFLTDESLKNIASLTLTNMQKILTNKKCDNLIS